MSTKLWFKAKRYGWGWYPSSWEGWLVTLAAVGVHSVVIIRLIQWFQYIDEVDPSKIPYWISTLFVWCVLFITFMFWVCYKKGEKPGWHWGNKK